jgi:hypothetical protein
VCTVTRRACGFDRTYCAHPKHSLIEFESSRKAIRVQVTLCAEMSCANVEKVNLDLDLDLNSETPTHSGPSLIQPTSCQQEKNERPCPIKRCHRVARGAAAVSPLHSHPPKRHPQTRALNRGGERSRSCSVVSPTVRFGPLIHFIHWSTRGSTRADSDRSRMRSHTNPSKRCQQSR